MSIWFEGTNDIQCTIQQVKNSFKNLGDHYVKVIGRMPGLTRVKLVEQGINFVIIKTNEGLMKRTNISQHIEAESVVMEFDEEYQAGSKITTTSHFLDEFTSSDTKVKHRIVISDVKAPGFLGFFYRNFGKSNTGGAFLKAYKTYFEKKDY